MSAETERNKQLARAFFDALSKSDIQATLDAYAEDGRVQTMGNTLISGVMTKDQIRAGAGAVLGAFPEGITFTIKLLIAEEDRVAVEAESYGRHVSGRIYNNQYHFLMRFRDGKLVELKEYMDTELVTEILCGGQKRN